MSMPRVSGDRRAAPPHVMGCAEGLERMVLHRVCSTQAWSDNGPECITTARRASGDPFSGQEHSGDD